MQNDNINERQKEIDNERQKEIDAIMADARLRIDHAIAEDGPYTHKMIGLTLQSVGKKIGPCYAEDLIKEYDIDSLYGVLEN